MRRPEIAVDAVRRGAALSHSRTYIRNGVHLPEQNLILEWSEHEADVLHLEVCVSTVVIQSTRT
jgi:hypothetical protein